MAAAMIDTTERRWVVRFAALFMLLTMLPYLLGYFMAGDEWRYSGLLIATEDGNSYIAKMMLGSIGDWLFRTPYTPFEQSGFLAFFPYILLGKLVSPPGAHDQLVALFHGFRILGGGLYIYGSYKFIAQFLQEKRWRKWAVVLVTVGGGLGFLSVMGLGGLWGERLPLEFYSPETFGFLAVLALPHLAAGRGMLLWGLSAYLGAREDVTPVRRGLLDGLWWVGLGFMQPLTVVVAWAIVGAHLSGGAVFCALKRLEWKTWRKYLLKAIGMGVVSMPMVAYTFFSFQFDPFLKNWQTQNIITSPPISDYILAFGVTVGLGAAAILRLFRKMEWRGLLLVVWVLVFPLLAYAPYNLQRRLPEGIWTAFVILALLGVCQWKPVWQKFGTGLMVVGILSSVILFMGGMVGVTQKSKPLFIPAAEAEIYEALAELAPKGSVVLAEYDVSNAMPAWAPMTTLVGHGPESIRLKEILPRVEKALSPESSDMDRQALLDEFQVDYVVVPKSLDRSGDWNSTTIQGLVSVYQNETWEIYQVGR